MIELIKWIEKRANMSKWLEYLKDSTDNINLMSIGSFIRTPNRSNCLLFFSYPTFSSTTCNVKSSSKHSKNQWFLSESWS